MSDRELKGLTPKMREIVQSLTDAHVANEPAVIAAVAELAAVEEGRSKRRDTRNAIETRLKGVESSLADVTERIEVITAGRYDLAVAILEGTARDDDDRAAQNKRADLQRQLDRLQLLKASFSSELERAINDASRPSHSNTHVDASAKLDAARFDAKCDIAMDRVNA